MESTVLRQLPWTASSAPASRPCLGDLETLADAAARLWPDHREEMAQALAHGWSAEGWRPLLAERWLADHLLSPIGVRDALHLRGEAVIRQVHAERVMAWVSRQNLVPQRALGDRVDLVMRGETVVGRIVAIDQRSACYFLRWDHQCDQIPEDLASVGVRVPYEMIHPWIAPSQPFALHSPT